ncbi:putative glycosidase [Medicago truncatula]|uniref:Putative glycosidase n=1 Tax=Medicago truncatula TaxID=3880 RepID=A0A396HZG2_MEDTR|nr:putative glycosidase [Medicago truncatula]
MKAFLKAWSDACKWKGKSTILIPNGTYTLRGPCNSSINFRLEGLLKAPIDPKSFASDNWINFKYVNKLMVGGGGSLDAQGAYAWKMNDCQKNPNCRPLPTSMKFDYITNGYIHHMHSFNSKQSHFGLYRCNNMTLTKLQIKAPGDSPNTDGIKIGKSTGINITSVNIRTGNDCISMLSGLKNVQIMDVYCGPGHGINIGSLGKYEDEEDLADIIVKNCTFNGTSNGVRIKSYESQLNKTVVASNFIYEDIVMENVEYHIVIDQHYCSNSGECNLL